MKFSKITIASALALGLVACAEEAETDDAMMADETAMSEDATAPGTIVEVAQGDETFSTLVEAVTAAELAETLSGEGPYTVFAPTDDAFAALPEGTLEQLTTEDTDTLKSILTYHVVEGSMDAAAVTSAIEDAGEEGLVLTTVNGGEITATMVGGSVMLTDATGESATVTATDVEASNGVIHVIDAVMMPE
jgi:uncharacterized surface protein with fasciclin (FAS1) repeats